MFHLTDSPPQIYIIAFKQLDSPIHVVSFGSVIAFPQCQNLAYNPRASVFYLLGDVVQLQASSFAYQPLQNIMQGLMGYDAFDLVLMHFAKDVDDSIACVEKPLNWWKLEDEFQRASHCCSLPFDVEPRVFSSEQTCIDLTINTIFRF
jgi:hypothetical protein